MTVATRTITTLATGFTQSQLSTFLQTAFTNAGFSSTYDSFTSGSDLCLVYSHVLDGAKTFGTSYLRVRITTAFVVYQQLFTAWNATAHTGSNGGTEVTCGTLVNTSPLVANAFSQGTESRLIMLTQGSTGYLLGMIAPNTRRGSWDLNAWNWGFIPSSNVMTAVYGSAIGQYGNTAYDIALSGSTRLGTANPNDNQRDIITGLVLLPQTNQGFAGKTSDDLGLVSGSGSTRYDTAIVSGSNQQFVIVVPASGGLAVRTV